MRIVTCFCVMALFLMSLATPRLTSARASMPSAYGNVKVSVGDGVTRDITFNVKTNEDGTTEGDLTLTDPSTTSDFDPDNPKGSRGSSPGFSTEVEVDCLVVDANRAAMSGVVVDSNVPSRIGQLILLTVEDNNEKASEPSRLTWGFYGNQTRTWTPSDAELPDDQGASRTWVATDAERQEAVGVPSNQSQVVDCDSFPLSSYSLVNIQYGDGNIHIKP